jgi:hypothetical protein
MALMNTSPVIPATPRLALLNVATANTARDGTGTIGTLVTGVATGTVVDRIRWKGVVASTAGMLRFFLHDGSTYFLIHEETIGATGAISGTVQSAEGEWAPDDLILPSASHSVRVSTNNAESINVCAHVRDY